MRTANLLQLAAALAGFLLLGVPQPQAADSASTLLSCTSRSASWGGRLEVDESGKAVLFLQRDSRKYQCVLQISAFNLSPRAKVPTVRMEFDRGACSPAIAPAELDKQIQTRLTIKLTPGGGKQKVKGLFQWLRYEQPGDCAVSRYNREGMRSAYSRWQNKTWGR